MSCGWEVHPGRPVLYATSIKLPGMHRADVAVDFCRCGHVCHYEFYTVRCCQCIGVPRKGRCYI